MSLRLQSVSYGLDVECVGAEVLALLCGLEASEELTVSELGVEGPFEIPDVDVVSVGELLEVLWTEENVGLSAEPSSASEGNGSVEQFVTMTDGCSAQFGVVARGMFASSQVNKVSTVPSRTEGDFSSK